MIKWKLAVAATVLLNSCGAGASQPSPPAPQGTPPRLVAGSISNVDYPPDAIRAREEGSVRMQVSVDADGSVTGCEILQSSGSAALDAQSCAIARERFRFEPGRTSDGTAAASVYRQSVRWMLPEDGPDGERVPFTRFTLAITGSLRDGQVASCTSKADGSRQPEPLESCQAVFRLWPGWDSIRTTLTSATYLIAFTPQGQAPADHDSEWGTFLLGVDTDIIIGPDGRPVGCTMPGQTSPQPCRGDAAGLPLFDAASEPERRGKVTSALFGVAGR